MTSAPKEEPKKIPRRTPCLCVILVLFLLGAAAIVGVLIWFGLEKSKDSEISSPDNDTKPPSVDGRDPLQRRMQELQRHIGAKPHVRREMFSNWDGTTIVPDVLITAPNNLDEIQRVVRAARALGLRVRCVGSAHSYSNLFPDDGQILVETRYLTSRHDGPPMEKLTPIWGVNLTVVTAAAGLVQEELVQFMIRNDVQMDATSHEMGAMLGGLFSTGSRGEDIRNGPVSEKLVAMRLVDSNGDLRSFNIIQNPNEMKVLSLCLGLCGVIYDISIRVTPLQVVRSTNTFPRQMDVVFNTTHLREITNKRSLQMYWSPLSSLTDAQWSEYDITGKIPRAYNPFLDVVWLRQIETLVDVNENVTIISRYVVGEDIPQTVPGMEVDQDFPNGTVGLPLKPENGSTTWNLTTTAVPSLYEATIAVTTESSVSDNAGTEEKDGEEEDSGDDSTGTAGFSLRYHQFALAYTKATAPSVYYAYLPEAVVLTNGSALDVIYAVQWDFMDDADFSTTVAVLNKTLHRLADYAYKGQMPVLTMVYKWHAKSPDCYLCPGDVTRDDGHVDHIFSLELIGPPGDPSYWKFINEMTKEWRALWPTSTPNWAKFYSTIPNIEQYLRSCFGSSMKNFMDGIQNMRLDPNQMFTNKVLRNIFY